MNREQHIKQVLREYSGWRRFRDPDGDSLRGVLRSESRTGTRATFHMSVLVPWKFPKEGVHPKATILGHDLRRPLTEDAHVGADGVMCVQMEERNEIDYGRDGLVAFMRQVEIHLARIRIWSLTKKYPGPEYAHGDEGRREYVAEVQRLRRPFSAIVEGLPPELRSSVHALPADSAKCPCGSDLPFSDCHKPAVTAAQVRLRELGPSPRPMMPTRTGRMRKLLNAFLRQRRQGR